MNKQSDFEFTTGLLLMTSKQLRYIEDPCARQHFDQTLTENSGLEKGHSTNSQKRTIRADQHPDLSQHIHLD